MNPFLMSYEKLAEDFRAHGIPIDAPGFCDHPAFLAVERNKPDYLNHYAAFVAKKTYDSEYLMRAKETVARVASLLHKELVDNGRLSACVDISGILTRILDREGIWSCAIKGSLTINFPLGSQLYPSHFWSIDYGNFVAGHAWTFAPPYTVVDISIKQQPYHKGEDTFLPETVLSEETTKVTVNVDDIIRPSCQKEMLASGYPQGRLLYLAVPNIPHIFESIPAVAVQGLRGAMLKYSPTAVHAPDGTFEEMKNMMFNGLTPWELYSTKLRGLLRN